MAARAPDGDRECAIRMYVAGHALKDIAEVVGYSEAAVQRWCKQAGVRQAGRGQRRASNLAFDLDEAIALVVRLQSFSEAARVLGVERTHLHNRIRRAGRMVKVASSNPMITGIPTRPEVRDRALDRYARFDGRLVDIAAEARVHPNTVAKWAAAEGLRRR